MSISYTTIATLIWIVVAVLIGINTAIFFFWPPRYAVFTVAAAVGLVLLIRVNLSRQRTKSEPKKLSPGPTTFLPAQTGDVATSISAPADKKLSPTEARQWLDDFLVQQQKNK